MKDNQTKHDVTAMNLVLKCGVPPYLDGCAYLTEATELYAAGDYSMMSIYRTIAARNHLKPKSVMRDISYAIEQSFDIGNRLSEIIGLEIPPTQIHNALVISYLATKLNE